MSDSYAEFNGMPLGSPVYKVASWVPMSREMLADSEGIRDVLAKASAAIEETWDRRLNPWKYPDTPRWPAFDLFPRSSRLILNARVARSRVRLAFGVLAGSVTWPEESFDD